MLIRAKFVVISPPGLMTVNSGRLRPPDSGKTHCYWVSPHLQLYFQVMAGERPVLSSAPDGASK